MNVFDSAIAFFSPERALRRARARMALRIYDGATSGRRGTSFRGRQTSANVELSSALGPLRERARDLTRNSPWAKRMIDVICAHSVGTGLRPVPYTGSDRLDERVMALWEEWQAQADAEGRLSFYAQQAVALRGVIESGEIVGRFVDRKLNGGKPSVPFKLQLLEADFIDSSRDGVTAQSGAPIGTQRSRLGVGLGENDELTGLWLFPVHPGEVTTANVHLQMALSKFYAKESVLHLFRPERPGQVRGCPWFASVLLTARDFSDFMDSVLMKARIEACFSAFIENPEDFEPVISADASGNFPPTASGADTTMLEPGMIKELRAGQKINFAQPSTTSQIEPVFMFSLMGLAAGLGCTYDQATGDLRGANYSSLRAGKIDFRALIEQIQELFLIPSLCQPVWERFIARATLAGQLRERKDGYPCNWITPAWQSINPRFDEDAEIKSVRAGRVTPQEFIASYGSDWRKNLKDWESFQKECEKRGLKFDILVSEVTRTGAVQKDPTATAGGGGGHAGNGQFTDSEGNPIDAQDLQDALDQIGGNGSNRGGASAGSVHPFLRLVS